MKMLTMFGLLLPDIVKKDLSPATVPVPNTLETHHHLMWVLTIIVIPPPLHTVPHNGTLIILSGMGKTATLGATAVLVHKCRGS